MCFSSRKEKPSYRPVDTLLNTSSVTLNYMGGFFYVCYLLNKVI